MRFYRAPNKRIIARAGNGRFRLTTLADIGGGVCRKCGKPHIPDLSGLGEFPDPREIRDRQTTCDECRKAEQHTET
jgi:hypothetical protein